MKDKTYLKEVVLSVLITIILVIFMKPFGLFVSLTAWMSLLAVLVVLFAVFSVLVWTIKPLDEREEEHMYFGSRLSFLAGSTFLTGGIVYQSFNGGFDIWLPAALAVMILAKVLGVMYCRYRK